MLIRFFRYIRKQPKPVRERYAFSFASVFTGFVALVWFTNSSALDFSRSEIVQKEESSTPFSTIIKQSKEQFASLRNAFSDGGVEEGSNVGEIENTNGGVVTADDPTKIILSKEDLDVMREQEKKPDLNTRNSTTTSSSTKPAYREVQLVTVSSSSTKNSKKATTTKSKDKTSSENTTNNTPTN